MTDDIDRDPDGGSSDGASRAPAPPIPRDEWVRNVVGDPASGERPVLLAGYVGDAADDEHTRIYLDPSLSSYVDVRDADVLHHAPLEGDHAPAGGSLVWVRGGALSGPPSAAAAGADFFTGPVLAQNRQPGAATGPVQTTLLTLGCPTHQLWCPAPTRLIGCTGYLGCGPQFTLGGPCGPGPVIPPEQAQLAAVGTAATTCTQVHCPQPEIGPTGWQGCGQPQISLPGCVHTGTCPIGQTGWLGCGQPQISLPGCVHTGTCPIGPTGWLGCGQPQISLPGCVHTGTCPIGPTGWQGCGQPQAAPGEANATTGLGCPRTNTCPPTYTPGCGGGAQTIATGHYAPQCPTFGFTCTYVNCPTGEAAARGAQQTIATGHYAPQCPTFGFTCTYVNCPTGGAAAPGAQQAIASSNPQCRTFGFTCTMVQCPTVQAQQAQQAAITNRPQCPTFGFTCTYVNCPNPPAGPGAQQAIGTAGPHCQTFGFTCTQFC
jgi:hypothetical protein